MAEKEFKIDEDEVLELAIKRYGDEVSLLNEEYELYESNLKFARNYENEQWDQRIYESRSSSIEFKPCLTVNKISEKVRTVLGEFEELDPGATISPVDSFADPVIADILGGIEKHVSSMSKAKMVYKTSYSNVLLSGIGGWKIDLKQDPLNPEASNIVIKSIANPFQVRWDPTAKEYDKSDAKYVFNLTEVSRKEFEEQYPDVDVSGWSTYNEGWTDKDTVTVAEYWWKEQVPDKVLQVLRNGQQDYVYQNDLIPTDQIISETATEVKRTKIYYGTLVHSQFIEGPFDDWPIENFPFVFHGGDFSFIDGLPRYYGLVHDARESQQMYNYFISVATEQILLQPRAPYVAEAESIDEYADDWDNPDAVRVVRYDSKGGTLSPPIRQDPPVLSQGISAMLQISSNDLMSSMGIHESSLSMPGPEVSGVAIDSKQRQGSLTVHPYLENFEASLTYSTQLIIDLIPFVYDTERLIRILGPDSKEKLVMINTTPQKAEQMQMSPETHTLSPSGLINDLKDAGRYDVLVKIGPSHASQREANLTMMVDLLKILPPSYADTVVPILIKYVDTPAAQELTKALEQRAQNQQKDPVVAVAEADVQRKTQADQAKFQIEQMKLQLDAQNEAHKREIEELKAFVEMFKARLTADQANLTEAKLGLDERQNMIRNQFEAEKIRQAQRAQQMQQMAARQHIVPQRTQQTLQPGPGQGINIPSTPTPSGGLE